MRARAWMLGVATMVMVAVAGCKKATPRKRELGPRPTPVVIDPSRPRAGATPVAAPDAGLAAAAVDAGLSPQAARAAALAQARSAGILGSLARQNGSAFKALTRSGNISSGFDDVDIHGGLLGNDPDPNGGFGFGRSGLGAGGGGTGGAGTGWGTIGTGRYGTLGTGSGTGSGYGTGRGRGGLGRSPSPSPAPKKPVPPARTSPPAPAMP